MSNEHTDGSRSGGQPVAAAIELLEDQICPWGSIYMRLGDEYIEAIQTLIAALRQPTQSDATLTALEQPTPELVEDVARAILNHRSPMVPDTEWAIQTDETRHWYRELADAALTAIDAHLRKA